LKKSNYLFSLLQENKPMTFGQQVQLTAFLSVPAILAEFSSIIMQYINAAMEGSLGVNASASIGLVATSTWLFWGIVTTVATGFSVQVAHRIGAGDKAGARKILRQSILATFAFSLLLVFVGSSIAFKLPHWLGGEAPIFADASNYFLIFVLSLPVLQLNYLAGAMLRSSGNIIVPGILNVLMAVLDVIFNFLLIYPTREIHLAGLSMQMLGAGLGVTGAALGTAASYVVTGLIMIYYLLVKDKNFHIIHEKGSFIPEKKMLQKAFKISLPMTVEHTVIMGAQIMSTVIVAPLGIAAIAANSFAITAEGLCYMPGYGIAEAATTLVGQSVGAQRKDLAKRFARISVFLGMFVMTFMGGILYFAAPTILHFMTSDAEIISLGVMALRIEAFAEPMFAAAIVG
jgi:putative MATE family efflux protein